LTGKRKAERLLQLEALLLAHPEGLIQAEIARRLGVHRSTVGRYLSYLPGHIYVDDLDGGRWKLDRSAYLVQVRFTLHEALSMHLASRLLATRTDKHNPHAAAALRKLGIALERLAPRISRHMLQSADVMDDAGQRHDPAYLGTLETLTLAWAEERKVRVWHRHEDSGNVHEYTFSPYFIEPYAVGHTTHIIGFREPPGAVRTFKVERIERAELLRESYTIPEDFDPRELLAEAWGIWYTEEEPREVVLRFQETRWHVSERTEEQKDGSLLWRAHVAELQEMLPWIRGWGADVEVLEPQELRETLRQESYQLANLYLAQEHPPSWFHLWAKATEDKFHPLLYHLIDVGQCALALWREALSPSMKECIADDLRLDGNSCANLLAFWTSLHDLGKATPAFQAKNPNCASKLRELGFDFPAMHGATASAHGVASTWCLTQLLEEETKMSRADARRTAHALGGHHGLWPNTVAVQSLSASERGGKAWEKVRRDLLAQLIKIFQPPLGVKLPDEVEDKNAFLTLLSGFTTASDWLGSMEDYFAYEPVYAPPEQYATTSAHRASEALSETGWAGGWQPRGQTHSFQQMFPTIEPNQVQEAVIRSARNIKPPSLLILEAPTGMGKTEAAFYLADTWLQSQLGRGLYVAMPTRATSNQMFGRTLKFLKKRYSEDRVEIHLAHAQAYWDAPAQRLKIAGVGEGFEDHVRAEGWFLPRKRTLLAPFAVGTVDQALMSVLQARHFFLRLFGLAHKVIIFDEVHAYDTYMEHLFLRLLTWLRAVGTSVIVLSATLPEKTRQAMVAAFTEKKTALHDVVPYPRLTIASPEEVQIIPTPAPEPHNVDFAWIDREPKTIAAELRARTHAGGCAAVICNTVGRAQEIYQALLDQGFSSEICSLFHARMPAAWRAKVEQQVLDAFGKDGQRPSKSILVATQVLEQSLDLDFDLMISDLAPMDLLIQRVGRLHRHDRERPAGLEKPLLILARPAGTLEEPDFGNDAYVYQRYILWQSWRALNQKVSLSLPVDTTDLIEFVYGDFDAQNLSASMAEGLQSAYQAMVRDFQQPGLEAKKRLVLEPDAEHLLTDAWQDLEDDENPALHPHMRALTRLIEPGVTLICLHRMPDGSLNLEPDGSGVRVELEQEPNKEDVRSLLHYAVSVHHRTIVRHFAQQMPWNAWRRSSALRYAYPVVFDEGSYALENGRITLTLDRRLGLRIIKEGS
jgi:CRISPR-associated endonuclease/helicase Cas3